MKAHETTLKPLIEGTKQYVIPLFQRTYSWVNSNWDKLWKDLVDLCNLENPRMHFFGSIVNMPTVSVPEGVTKYLLIDGQQRLTTIFILLTLLRNKAKENQINNFANKMDTLYLVNPYENGIDHYKLMPTQVDREAYCHLIDGDKLIGENPLTKAYTFFEKKLRQEAIDSEKLLSVITNYLSVVSIVLDADDDPYLVFASLNADGKQLTHADLIRNYFFMQIHIDHQDEIYKKYWMPMQEALKDTLTEFIRHYLMRTGEIVKKGDVYYYLKELVSKTNAIDYLKNLSKYSTFYQRLMSPELESDFELATMFSRLNRIEVTTAYPLLLNFYGNYDAGIIDRNAFVAILKTLENYLIRRFVCNIATNQLNKIFPSVCVLIQQQYANDIVSGFKTILQGKGYPKDNEFLARFEDTKFYGGGDRAVKTKLILETIESSYHHKEVISFENLTVEHIMPQKLSNWWQEHLGETCDETHELYLHTIGNLTLTAYNPELSNDDFITKKKILGESHLEMNMYFADINNWTKSEIENRAKVLAKKASEIWYYFGQENALTINDQDVTGTTPTTLKILGQTFEVSSWRDVMEKTLNVIADLEPEKFDIIVHNFSRYVGKDKNTFREVRKLENDYYIEVNLSALYIKKFCHQAMETIELTSDEWRVETR